MFYNGFSKKKRDEANFKAGWIKRAVGIKRDIFYGCITSYCDYDERNDRSKKSWVKNIYGKSRESFKRSEKNRRE
jgi:hypothetical protein